MKTDETTLAEVAELQQKIANLFGHPWTIGKPAMPHHFEVQRPDGSCLYFAAGHIRGKWHIGGEFPRHGSDWFAPAVRQTINVSRERSAADIVKEVKRRLLPWYDVAYEVAVQQKKDFIAAQNLKHENAKKLLTALGYRHMKLVTPDKTRFTPYCGGVIDLVIGIDGKARITTDDCSVECLLEIFEVLKWRHRASK